jgi:hypothetical protein
MRIDASLWISDAALRCASRAQGERLADRGVEAWRSWRFRVELPPEIVRQDEALGNVGRAFTGAFFSRVPRGKQVLSLRVVAHTPQDIVSSFVHRGTLMAAVEGLVAGTEVEITVGLGVAVGAEPHRSAPRYPSADRPRVARLRRFGHGFLLQHKRLPAPSEVAEGLGLEREEAARLLALTHAPVCEEDVRRGALPRLTFVSPRQREPAGSLDDFLEVGGEATPARSSAQQLSEQTKRVLRSLTPREEAVLRGRFGIGERTDVSLEEIGHDFEVTRERIRPISARALRALRRPSRKT